MRPKRNTKIMGPPAVCNVCGASCMTLNQAGQPCPRCNAGDLIHRRFWDTTECPVCHWSSGGLCGHCGGHGYLATPREDINMDDLRAYHPRVCFGNPTEGVLENGDAGTPVRQ